MPTSLLRCALFLMGLLALDQVVLWVGKRWDPAEQTERAFLSHFASTQAWDSLIIGNCRAMALDSDQLETRLHSRFFHTARSAEALGMMAFHMGVTLSQVQHKRVFVVLDDWVLTAAARDAQVELDRRLPYTDFLSAEESLFLKETFSMPSSARWLNHSGLYRFRGEGVAILKRVWQGPHPITWEQPRPSYSSVPFSRDLYAGLQTRRWEPSPVALTVLNHFLEKAPSKNIEVILIAAPHHELRISDSVRRHISQTVETLGQRHHIRVLNFLTNGPRFAERDELWRDLGHLSIAGEQLFTHTVGQVLSTP